MNSCVLYLVSSFVTMSLFCVYVDRFVHGSTQSECELTGFRLSSATAPPLPHPATISSSSRLAVTPSARFAAAHSIHLTRFVVLISSVYYAIIAPLSRSAIIAAPPCSAIVSPLACLAVALAPLSSREENGSAQHELGPNRSGGLSVVVHPPSSVESPQASGEHNLSPVGAPSPSPGGLSEPCTSSGKISLVWASSNTWASRDAMSFSSSSMAKCVWAFRVLTVHYHSSLRRISPMFSSILYSSLPNTFMELELKLLSSVSPPRSLSISTLKAVPSTTLCEVLLRQSLRSSLQYNQCSASPDPINNYLLEDVPSTTLCVVLLRQPLCTSLQHRETQSPSETVFSCSQNPLIGFFNVDSDFIAFLGMQARVLQVKLLYGSLLFSAITILYHVMFFLAFQFIIEFLYYCNRPLGV